MSLISQFDFLEWPAVMTDWMIGMAVLLGLSVFFSGAFTALVLVWISQQKKRKR